MSLRGWEEEGWGWGCLGSHQSLSTVYCLCRHRGLGIEGRRLVWSEFVRGLSYFASALISSSTCKWNLILQFRSALLLMASLRNWAGELYALLNGNEMKGCIQMTA